MIAAGNDPLDAVIAGVNIVEDDPDDVTVGYGGIPNEEGVVQLDASVMDGRTMKSGAVGALESIKNPSKVARLVMDQTNRAFLVGEGALKFARAHGVPGAEPPDRALPEDLALLEGEALEHRRLDRARRRGAEGPRHPLVHREVRRRRTSGPQGTINCNAVTADGDIVGTTTTSGLFFKLPGRLGDSPVIGAGLYVDGEVGACGSTGWGEGNIRFCGSHTVVEMMRQGKSPEEAALKTLERISSTARSTTRQERPAGLQHQLLRREQEGRVRGRVDLERLVRDGKDPAPGAVRRGRRLGRKAPGVGVPLEAAGEMTERGG